MKHCFETLYLVGLFYVVSTIPLRLYGHEDSTREFAFSAGRLILYPHLDEIRGEDDVAIATPLGSVVGPSLTLYLLEEALVLPFPKMELTEPAISIRARYLSIERHGNRIRLVEPELYMVGIGAVVSARLMTCMPHQCSLELATIQLCPHTANLLVEATEIHLDRSGDLQIVEGRLKVDRHSVPIASKLRLRSPNKSGLTVPRLAFHPEAGFIVGTGGILALDRTTSMSGRFALRSRQGFETLTRFQSEETNARLDHLLIHGNNHFRLRISTAFLLENTTVYSDVDWVSKDRYIVDQLAQFPTAEVLTHTRSEVRLPFIIKNSTIETSLLHVQTFSRSGRLTDPSQSVVKLSADIVPQLFFENIFPALYFNAARSGFFEEKHLREFGDPSPPHISLYAQPILAISRKFGPASLSVFASSQHQVWRFDDVTIGIFDYHQAGASFESKFPFFKDFDTLRHIITPYARYRLIPWQHGAHPFFVPVWRENVVGHAFDVGMSTTLSNDTSRYTANLDVYERANLPGVATDPKFLFLSIRGVLHYDPFTVRFESALDHDTHRPSITWGEISYEFHKYLVRIGGRYIGTGKGPHNTDSPLFGSFPWSYGPLFSSIPANVEAYLSYNFVMNRNIDLFGGTRFGVHPTTEIHGIWYGIDAHSSCRCLSVSLMASHRPESVLPAIYATVSLRPH